MNPLVKAVDLRKSYGEFQALHGINLDVAKGEVLCIIGPSGSGIPARREQALSAL
jgi:polar amino acid transport system ATP-binding protein